MLVCFLFSFNASCHLFLQQFVFLVIYEIVEIWENIPHRASLVYIKTDTGSTLEPSALNF